MRKPGPPTDPRAFALRREMRDVIDDLLTRGTWSPAEFDRAIERLAADRPLAVRQLLSCYREQRIADEVAAIEVLGRLADETTEPLLAVAANDPAEPEAARAACAMILLGRERAEVLRAPDLSRAVLRWQARYVAEEPALRTPLARLYASAARDERARWIELQAQELADPAARAATFEMILDGERDDALRTRILELMVGDARPETRAALARLAPRSPAEAATIERALTRGAAPAPVPDGWSARIGCCDGTGAFPLRLDFRATGRRPACAIFILDLWSGVRDALALSGCEVERYDRRTGPCDDDAPDGELAPVDVPLALGFLAQAERALVETGATTPVDHARARRVLDPLADVRPASPGSLPARLEPGAESRSAELLDHAGYTGWFYDSGEHAMREARLLTLDRCPPGRMPDDALVDVAARALEADGAPDRLAPMLLHNAFVHDAAGDAERSAIAVTTAAAARNGRFAELPLVRAMIRLSLHPGHHFFTPLPEVPDRGDVACLMRGHSALTRGDVLAIDLAWIYARAFEVWLSRLPAWQRPHGDAVERAVHGAATRAARGLVAAASRGGRDALDDVLDDDDGPLARLLARAMADAGLPPTPADGRRALLVRLLREATTTLLREVCLGGCPERCPLDPDADGAPALDRFDFPAGEAARARIVNWPGLLFEAPDAAQRVALSRFLRASGIDLARCGATTGRATAVFTCSLCQDRRPMTAISRSAVGGDPARPVCRRCQRRYRHDDAFRGRVDARLAPLLTR